MCPIPGFAEFFSIQSVATVVGQQRSVGADEPLSGQDKDTDPGSPLSVTGIPCSYVNKLFFTPSSQAFQERFIWVW